MQDYELSRRLIAMTCIYEGETLLWTSFNPFLVTFEGELGQL